MKCMKPASLNIKAAAILNFNSTTENNSNLISSRRLQKQFLMGVLLLNKQIITYED